MEKFSHNKIDSGDLEAGFDSDPALKAISDSKLKRTAEKYDIVRSLHDQVYAGTGTKEELRELECTLSHMLNEGKFGYNYIQNYLRTVGYQDNIVRAVFRKLTGVDPDIYQDPQPFLETPGNIPGLNYGWGAAKDKKYDHYFIMPYNLGYQIFGQKGDTQRDEVIYMLDLAEAREWLEKHTHEAMWWDKVKKHNIKEKDHNHQDLSEPLPMGTKTAKYQSLRSDFEKLGDRLTYTERRASIKNALSTGAITKDESLELLNKYAINRFANPDVKDIDEKGGKNEEKELEDELEGESEKMMEKPVEEELDEKSPSDFFNSQKGDAVEKDVHFFVKNVTDYLSELNASLTEFKVDMKSLKYIKKSTSSRLEQNVVTPNSGLEETFLSGAVMAVVVDIVDSTLPSEGNCKPGFALFTVIDGAIVTTGTFKGVDNKIYSLSEEGFQKYFLEERNRNK